VLDVDGTLLDPAHRISAANRAAVRRARAAGLHVLLASGRSPGALRFVLDALELDGPAIAYTGALTFRLEPGTGAVRTLAETPLDPVDAAAVLELADGLGVEVGWYAGDGWRVSRLGPGAIEEADVTDEPPLVSPGLPAGAPAPHKLMCMVPDLAGAPALAALRAALPPGTRGQFSHPRYLEVTAAGVDKAHAVRAACVQLAVPLAALAAIGDQENDVGMLREAGIGIAMGNAVAAVRAVADRTTDTNGQDGVALAIDALLGG